ncbi:MAG: homogentisate 1,2-dioxygenase [Gammaproteobacteria bacterium]|nr:homogentisate 1,2-dioxygenase [Gammaproteobacteria bacterium]
MTLSGFGNYHATEATPGALPPNQNAPQHCSHDLYAEQLSGSAFTQPRHQNLYSWLYRTKPSVNQNDFTPYTSTPRQPFAAAQPPNPFRWSPFPTPSTPQDFLEGLFHVAGNQGLNTYIYRCTTSMNKKFFNNRDGELLFVPYQGELLLRTEFGALTIRPGWIAVIPRGVNFTVELLTNCACGYLCENGGAPLTLPQLGPIGANGLANPRHFLYPTALVDESLEDVDIICKYQQNLWISENNHTPLNVVAWHGRYAPYAYDLSLFNTINTVSFDHPDPSIFTVLTSESQTPGVAHLDFVIFPPRWMVAEHTFRPPYFHRNFMSELMGLIQGEYDAKQEGFSVGGVSIHNCMAPHGPDAETHKMATTEALEPKRYEDTLAFMFESHLPWLVTTDALAHPLRQLDYTSCWSF